MGNAGKTYALKKIVEHLAMVPSMRNVIIFDVKGDWPQILLPSEDAATDEETKERAVNFDARCALRVYTFGTEKGWKATLNDLPVKVSAADYSGRDKQNIVNQRLYNSAVDVLTSVGIVKTNGEGKSTLLISIPSLNSTAFGSIAEEKKQKKAEELVGVCKIMCQKMISLGIDLPDSYETFANGLEHAHETFINPGDQNDTKDGVILSGLTPDDLRAVATKIKTMIQDDGFNALYEPKGETDEAAPQLLHDFYPMNAETLCGASSRDRKEVKVSVIKLDLLNQSEKETVVQTVLQRLEAYRRMTIDDSSGQAGGRNEPTTAIFIDEAHEAMPKPSSQKKAAEGATGVVKQILRLGHSSGFVVCLGTHRPQDIHPMVLEAIAGPIFIGAVHKTDKNLSEVKDCLLGLGKKTGGKKRKNDGSPKTMDQRVLDLLRSVDGEKHEFLYRQGSNDTVPTRIAFERLCRFHADAGPWQKHPIDSSVDHPMVKYVQKIYAEWVRTSNSTPDLDDEDAD